MSLDLSFPRDPYAEFYLKGDWHNLITHIRQSPPIKIQRGKQAESGKPTPSMCTFVMDDGADRGNGDYSPENPNGQWFPDWGRNVPVRLGMNVGSDDFTRTEVSGWGTSPQNGAWSDLTTGNSTSSVSGGKGVHTITDDLNFHMNYLNGIDVRDIEVAVTCTISGVSNVTGGSLEPAGIVLRGLDTSTYYLIRLTITSLEQVELTIRLEQSSGGSILRGPEILPWAYSGQPWRIRAQFDNKTIRAKAWPTTVAEPLLWQVSNIRASPFGEGFVGIRSGVAASNTNIPVTFQYDDFQLRLPRYTGETSSVTPNASISGTDRTAAVQCGTVYRRRAQGKSPLKSAIRRAIEQENVIAYWPMEDGKTSDQIAAVVGQNMTITGTGKPKLAASDIFLASDPLPYIESARFGAYIDDHVVNGIYQFRWIQHVPSGQDALTVFVWQFRFSGSAFLWHIQLESDGSMSVRSFGDGGILLDDTTTDTITDKLMYVQFSVDQNGADIDYSMTYEYIGFDTTQSYASGTVSGQTIGKLKDVAIVTAPAGSGTVGPQNTTVGHLNIETTITGTNQFRNELNAYKGETAIDRMKRLANENGIIISDCVDSEISAYMGPQQSDTLVNLLIECAATDSGGDSSVVSFTESRGANDFSYRALDRVYSSSPLVTLDYTAGYIGHPFIPVSDDQQTRNEVTASARAGSTFSVEKSTGDLNVEDPGSIAGAVGRYDIKVDVNPYTYEQLVDCANWSLHLGTVKEPRFPAMRIDMTKTTTGELSVQQAIRILDTNVASVVAITDLEEWYIYDTVRQLVIGYEEVFDTAYLHDIWFITVPASPYDVGSLDDGELRLDSGSSTLNTQFVAGTDTSMSVATSDVDDLWITTATVPGDFPFDIKVSGVVLTVTAITGSSSPQTFTITQTPVNGVTKTIEAGEVVSLAKPFYLAL